MGIIFFMGTWMTYTRVASVPISSLSSTSTWTSPPSSSLTPAHWPRNAAAGRWKNPLNISDWKIQWLKTKLPRAPVMTSLPAAASPDHVDQSSNPSALLQELLNSCQAILPCSCWPLKNLSSQPNGNPSLQLAYRNSKSCINDKLVWTIYTTKWNI